MTRPALLQSLHDQLTRRSTDAPLLFLCVVVPVVAVSRVPERSPPFFGLEPEHLHDVWEAFLQHP